jgi:hypothetical protein
MKPIALIFLLIPISANCAELLTFGPAICGFGQYRYNGTCTDFDINHSDCAKYFENNNGHLITLDVSTFRFTESGARECYGPYSTYSYDKTRIHPVSSKGTYLYTVTKSAPICGFGQYHLNGTCYTYNDADSTGKCKSDYHIMGAPDSSFMRPITEKPYCNGDYSLYDYATGTFDSIYPMYHGTLLLFGPAIGKVADMKTHACSVNSNNYYQIGITAQGSYAYPERGMCATGYSKFVVKYNCWQIDTTDSTTLNNAHICGVLCEKPEYVYTNSGRCSTEGYCENGDKKMRLHVALPGANGKKYSYPLYASKTSDPAMHFKFVNTSGAEQMCYVNLVPPEAIEHFVGTKPNPIRTMFYNPTTGENETLITID